MSETFRRLTGAEDGWRALPGRGTLRVSGADRLRFLNGMISNEVESLAPGRFCYATLLDRKGRILSDLFALVTEDAVLLDCAEGTAAHVREVLEKHVVADDVEVEDRSAEWGQLAFEGPGARAALAALGAPTPDAGTFALAARDGAEFAWLAGGRVTAEGVRVLGPGSGLAALAAASGLPELSDADFEVLRVASFVPLYGRDMTERSFPAEARLGDAISLTKGCYIGQEIVARIESRGAVNRLRVLLRCEVPMQPGAEIRSGDSAIGSVTSAVVSPLDGPLAMGYVRADHAAPGTEVAVGGASALVTGPPLDDVPAAE